MRRPRKSKSGEYLHRHLEIVVVYPTGVKTRRKWRAGPHEGFSSEQIDSLIEKFVDHLEQQHPSWEFRLVERGPAKFSFVYEKLRDKSEAVTT